MLPVHMASVLATLPLCGMQQRAIAERPYSHRVPIFSPLHFQSLHPEVPEAQHYKLQRSAITKYNNEHSLCMCDTQCAEP